MVDEKRWIDSAEGDVAAQRFLVCLTNSASSLHLQRIPEARNPAYFRNLNAASVESFCNRSAYG